MSKAPRPILAAGSSSGQSTTKDTAMGSGQDPSRSLGGRPKRTLIESACRACRKRKSRCDGARPTCSRCQSLRTDCIYEAEEGESRWSALKRRNQTLEAERDELLDVLTQLRSRPQSEAQDMLERIRRSSSSELPSVLREAVGSGATNPSQRASSDASSETRLPGIQTMFDVAGAERTERSSAGPPGSRGPTRQRSIGSDGSGDSYMSYSSTHSALERSGSQSSKP